MTAAQQLGAGKLPEWADSDDGLRSYFENGYGEQWFALAQPTVFLLAGSEIAWRTLELREPNYSVLAEDVIQPVWSPTSHMLMLPEAQDLMLGPDDAAWLRGIFLAAQERFGGTDS